MFMIVIGYSGRNKIDRVSAMKRSISTEVITYFRVSTLSQDLTVMSDEVVSVMSDPRCHVFTLHLSAFIAS